MYEVFGQTAVLILCGIAWRHLRPFGLEPAVVRRVLSSVVYGLLLPALVLKVLWHAPLGVEALRIAAVAAGGILAGLAMAGLWYRRRPPDRPAAGALLLAAGFGNVTYLGLPVLEATLGSWARSVAIQYDLFASTPLLLTLGILLARRYGESDASENLSTTLLKVPPLWAALASVMLTWQGVAPPEWIATLLERLAAGVIPLMLLVVGLGMEWRPGASARLALLAPVVLIQLVLMPLVVWGLAGWLGLRGGLLTAAVLEAAMPSMVLGIVLCDRYRLDTALYAQAVTLSTVLSLLSLPAWYAFLS